MLDAYPAQISRILAAARVVRIDEPPPFFAVDVSRSKGIGDNTFVCYVQNANCCIPLPTIIKSLAARSVRAALLSEYSVNERDKKRLRKDLFRFPDPVVRIRGTR